LVGVKSSNATVASSSSMSLSTSFAGEDFTGVFSWDRSLEESEAMAVSSSKGGPNGIVFSSVGACDESQDDSAADTSSITLVGE
jgi:hypothetical protein